MARILDFSDGFTSANAPTVIGYPASSVVFTPYGTVSSTNVQDALEELIDEKIQEIVSTDNAVARFDGITGDLQNSGVLIDDNDNLTLPNQLIFGKQDVASAASIVQLTSSKSFIRITGSTVTSVLGVLAGVDGQIVTIHNACSEIVTFVHEDAGATAADRMKFTDATDVDVDPDSSIELIYDGAQSRWVIKSGAGTNKLVGYQESPTGLVNGVNPNYQLSAEPVTTDSLIVFVDGIVASNDQWSLSTTTITFGGSYIPATGQSVYVWYLSKGTPNPVPPPPTGTFQVEYRILTAPEVAAKQLTLAFTPNTPAKVLLDIVGGTTQIYTTDYIVSGSTMDWTGLGLDGVVTAGDTFRIVYFS